MCYGGRTWTICKLKRQGLSIRAISRLTGMDRNTIRKYLLTSEVPVYGPRGVQASKLDGFKDYLQGRMQAGVWNARVLLRELRERGFGGSYTLLTDWLHPQREAARVVAVRRFETPPGQRGQVDWGHLGSLQIGEQERPLWGFTLTLGYSRMMMAEAALDQKLGTLLRMHEEGFRQLGGVPAEILYDRMKTVWLGVDERGEILWHPVAGLRRVWGLPAAAVPAVSGPNQRQNRVGSEIHTEKFPVRVAGARTDRIGRPQHAATGVGLGGGQSAGAWDDARAGHGSWGGRTGEPAGAGQPPTVPLSG